MATVIKSRLRTAVEVAADPAPPPLPPPPIPLPDLPPLTSDVDIRTASNGRNRQQAEHFLREMGRAAMVRQRTISPAFAAVTDALHTDGVAKLTEGASRVHEQVHRATDLENRLRARAELLAQVATDTAELAAAKAALDCPAALDLPDEKLLSLNNVVRWMPQRIGETKAKVDPLTTEILELAKAGEISIPALMDDIYKAAGRTPDADYVKDARLRSLVEAGHYRVSE